MFLMPAYIFFVKKADLDKSFTAKLQKTYCEMIDGMVKGMN